MDKKKLNTKDGSEFTVFYLKEQSEQPMGKPFEIDLNQLKQDIELGEDPVFGYPALSVKDFSFPYFNLPFSKKEKIMIDDKIEKDEEKAPQAGGIYFYSENMEMYEFVDEFMVSILDENLPMYELQDVQNNTFFVKAEDVKLYFTMPSEAADFINKKES